MPQPLRNPGKIFDDLRMLGEISTPQVTFSGRPTSPTHPYDGRAAVPASELPPAKAKHEPHRKRCTNCPRFFITKTDTQRFCSPRCRKEFHANGSAFGPLRDKLPKFIAKETAKQLLELAARIDGQEKRIAMLEEQMRLERAM